MPTVVKNLFRSRAESYFDSNITSADVLPKICKALRKYGLFAYFKLWFENCFPCVLTVESNCEAKTS